MTVTQQLNTSICVSMSAFTSCTNLSPGRDAVAFTCMRALLEFFSVHENAAKCSLQLRCAEKALRSWILDLLLLYIVEIPVETCCGQFAHHSMLGLSFRRLGTTGGAAFRGRDLVLTLLNQGELHLIIVTLSDRNTGFIAHHI